MSLAERPLIVTDSDGVMRVRTTRVTLDTIVAAFREGMTAEGIAEQYPSLSLADVYGAITFYLNHDKEVAAYIRGRQLQAEEVRRENEARFDPIGVRDRLLARKSPG